MGNPCARVGLSTCSDDGVRGKSEGNAVTQFPATEVHAVGAAIIQLDKLIVLKRAAGRPKDLAVVAELQGILERRKEPGAP